MMTTTERLAFVFLALLPVLTAVCASAGLSRTIVYWKKETTAKNLSYALAFWALTVTLLLSGVERTIDRSATKDLFAIARSTAFFLSIFLIIIGQVFSWIELLSSLRAESRVISELKVQQSGGVSEASRALVLAAETSIIAAEQAKRAVIAVEKEHASAAAVAPTEPGG